MSSDLYKKHNYLNKNIDLIISSTIQEYDMREAGFNLCKEFNLLKKSTIDILEEQTKSQRHISIGKIQRKDKEFSKNLTESFVLARKMFFEANDIEDNDILSIKKDAILTLSYCNKTKFGDYIEFREKKEYTSYMYIKTKTSNPLEIYYNNQYGIDVKGIDDACLIHHKNYLLSFIEKIFRLLENDDKASVLRTLKRFSSAYKSLALDVNYYREFNGISMIRLKDFSDTNILYDNYWDDKKEDIDIIYNFINIIVPIINIVIS